MSQGIQLEVWGPYALFTRPELKVERASYDVMTPSAARGLVEAIYFHPGLRWHIDRIHVLNPIAFTNLRRNEVKDKVPASNVRSVMMGAAKPLAIYTGESIQQRASMLLTNVRYVIEAHFTMTDRANPTDNEGNSLTSPGEEFQAGNVFTSRALDAANFPPVFAPGPEAPSPPLTRRAIWA